jgi:tRNA pseudouridine55 synthase
MELFGFLNINKSSGITSRRVVDRVQRIARPAKVGHAGTLDPLASGVLVVGVGPATRLFEFIQEMTKSYRGTFVLGQRSTTEDVEGDVTTLVDPPRPTRQALVAAASQLTGAVQQRPPAFSALKVDGRRAYALARAGQEVELAPRSIHIQRFDIVDYEYPRLVADVECSSGTYIRSLGRDLAERVGTAATMSALERTAIGPFTLDGAVDLETVDRETFDRLLLSPTLAVQGLMPQIAVGDKDASRLANGLPICPDPVAGCGRMAAVDATGRLIAILAPRADGSFGPVKYFPQASTT